MATSATITPLNELVTRYEADHEQAQATLDIPTEVIRRIAEGESLGVLADLAVTRSGIFDVEMIRAYNDTEQKLQAAEGEPVLVVATRTSSFKKGKILNANLAKPHGGSYLPHEVEILRHQGNIPTDSMNFFLGTVAAGGPYVDIAAGSKFIAETDDLLFGDNEDFRIEDAWQIPTEAGFIFANIYSRYGRFEDEEVAITDTDSVETIEGPITVHDFRADFKSGEPPHALGRELKTQAWKVDGSAVRWRVSEQLRTDVLIGEAEIAEAGLERVQAVMLDPESVRRPREYFID